MIRFSLDTNENDVCMIKVKAPGFTFNEFVQPGKLPEKDSIPLGELSKINDKWQDLPQATS